jgi:hypothetical protein
MVDLSSYLFLFWFNFSSPESLLLAFGDSIFRGTFGTDLGVHTSYMTHEEHICKSIWLDSSRAQSWGILRKVWKSTIWSEDFLIYGVSLVFWLRASRDIFLTSPSSSLSNFISFGLDDMRWICLLGESFVQQAVQSRPGSPKTWPGRL